MATRFPPIGLTAVIDNINNFEKSSNRIVASYDSMDQAADNVSSASVGLGGILTGLGTVLATVVVVAAAAAAAAIAGMVIGLIKLGSAAIKTGAEYTKEMSNVKALTGATEEEFKNLEASAEELGATTKFTAAEAAAGMGFLAMAGFETNEIISAMPGVLNLAAAGNLELAQSADIVSNILTGFGEEVDQTGRFVDVLTQTMTSSNTNLIQLGEGMKFVAPLAGSLGISVEDTASAMGALGDAGIQGTMGGTALRAMLLSLSAPTDKAAEKMKGLGIDVFDAEGKMLPFPGLVGELEESLGDLNDQARLDTLKTIFGKRNVAAVSILLKKGEDDLQAYGDELRNSAGRAAEIAAIQLDNLSGDVTLLSSAFSGVKIDIFKKLEPLLRSIVQFATKMIKFIGPPLVEFYGFLADFATPIINNFQDAFGIFFETLSSGKGIVSSIKGALAKLLPPELSIAVNHLLDAFRILASKIFPILFVGAEEGGNILKNILGGAVSFLANTVLPKLSRFILRIAQNWDSWIRAIKDVIAWIKDLVKIFQEGGLFGSQDPSGGGVEGLLSALGIPPNIINIIESVINGIKDVIKGFQEGGLGGGLSALFTADVDILGSIIDTISDFIADNWPKIEKKLQEWGDMFFDWVTKTVIPGIPKFLDGIIDTITGWATKQGPTIQDSVRTWKDGFWDWINPIIDQAGAILAGIITAIALWAASPETQAKLIEMGKALGAMIVTGIKNLFANQQAIAEVMLKIIGGLLAAVVVLGVLLIGIGGLMMASIIAGIVEKITGIKVALSTNMMPLLISFGDQIKTTAKSVGIKIILAIAQGILDTIKKIEKAWLEIKNFFVTGFENLKIMLTTYVTDSILGWQTFLNNLKLIITTEWDNIKNIFITALNNIVAFLTEKLSEIVDMWKTNFENIKTIVSEILDSIENIINDVIQDIINAFDRLKEIAEAVKEAFRFAVNEVKEGIQNVLSAIDDTISDFVNIGADIMAGLLQGLEDNIDAIWDFFTDMATGILDFMSDMFTFGSPSRVFFDFGQNIMAGLQQGLASMTPDIMDQFQASIGDPVGNINAPVTPSSAAIGGGQIGDNNTAISNEGDTFNFNVETTAAPDQIFQQYMMTRALVTL